VFRSFTASAMVIALIVIAAATAIGIQANWPHRQKIAGARSAHQPKNVGARVVAIRETPCRYPGARRCERVTQKLTAGPDKGKTTQMTLGDTGPVPVSVGDDVFVYKNRLPPHAVLRGRKLDAYSFADYNRHSSLIWLTAVFAVLVVITGRFQGLRALLGLAASLAIVLYFVVPAILDGRAPASVAIWGALAVMLVTIPLIYGIGAKALAACLGTAAALLVTLLFAKSFSSLAHLTGLSSDEAVYLQTITGKLSVQGLFLAGMVIGALGVLTDLTVSQASTVMAIKAARPDISFAALFKHSQAVGHDHIAATVNTLVLAYAGASLPILLIFKLGGVSFGSAVNSESVAEEIVATLVGSVGLILAVPITNALATLLAIRLRPAELGKVDGHGHAH